MLCLCLYLFFILLLFLSQNLIELSILVWFILHQTILFVKGHLAIVLLFLSSFGLLILIRIRKSCILSIYLLRWIMLMIFDCVFWSDMLGMMLEHRDTLRVVLKIYLLSLIIRIVFFIHLLLVLLNLMKVLMSVIPRLFLVRVIDLFNSI